MQKSKRQNMSHLKPTRKTAKRHNSRYLKYAKFLPAAIFFLASIGLRHTNASPYINNNKQTRVLSYATAISGADLLGQTNAQRSANSVIALSANNQLTTAAQTKADDMVQRDYWSHTTPDGQEPWVFIANTGYQYQTAGENLAYGFTTSSDVVTGWMNSPPHRQNLLNTAFSEVGFGFANSPNYVGSGQQTVVVAMYASPLAPIAATPINDTPQSAPKSAPQSVPASTAPSSAKSSSAPPAPISTSSPEPLQSPSPNVTETSAGNNPTAALAKTTTKTPFAATASVRRIQVLTGGNARWSSTLLAFSICGVGILWALERGRQIRKLALTGEHFILKHIHIDFAVLGFVTLGITLLQTSGLVR